jgi:hypothetical protein
VLADKARFKLLIEENRTWLKKGLLAKSPKFDQKYEQIFPVRALLKSFSAWL